MKKSILVVLINCTTYLAFGQNSVLIDPSSPNPNIIQANSTSQAIQLPRVANTSSIASPQTGQIIYNSSTASPNFYNGTTWQTVGPSNIFPNSVGFTGLGGTNTNTNANTHYTYAIPAGVTRIWVEMWSGGSSGHIFLNSFSLPTNYNGGNGGGYLSAILNVTAGNLLDIYAGSGGQGAYISNTSGYQGTTSSISFNSSTLLSVNYTGYTITATNLAGLLSFIAGEAGKFTRFAFQTFGANSYCMIYGGEGGAAYMAKGGEGIQAQTNPNTTGTIAVTNTGTGGDGAFPGGGGGTGNSVAGNGAGGLIIIHY